MTARPATAAPPGLLELWHPSGAPARRLGLGAGAPVYAPADGAAADFALLAPAGGELRARWLAAAVGHAESALAADGVLCVVVPRRWRAVALGLIRRAGLTPVARVLVAPPWPRSEHAVSIEPAALADAAVRRLGLRPPAARAAAALGPAAARALACQAAPGCALVAARSPRLDPLRWLAALDGEETACSAVASVGARRDARVGVVLRFDGGQRAPRVVAKVALDAGGAARLDRERVALGTLGGAARRAGAAVPALIATDAPAVLVMTALPGRPASALLARADPTRVHSVAAAIADWLRAWAAATAAAAPADAVLDRLLREPASIVLPALDAGSAARYGAALESLAARLGGCSIVLSAAHNDLTMANVLVAEGSIGIVDWESAGPVGPPLADLWYALADALFRTRPTTRAAAVAALARGAAAIPAGLAGAPERHARELGIGADEALLSFHACWLHHAANELRRAPGAAGPFCEIVAAVADQRLLWPAAQGGGRP